MRLFVSRGRKPNFGDELNLWLWPKVFGDVWSDSDPEIFLGIGSVLYDSFPRHQKKVVFGAGYGGYTGKPDMHDGSWEVYFVRGPQTAELMGLDPSLALTDPATLIRTVNLPKHLGERTVSFMPHYESIERGNWEKVCEKAGIRFINPCTSVDDVLRLINGSEVLLTEAMHGAIVADALRIPWVPFQPVVQTHHLKWTDWTRSVELPLNAVPLLPSSSREAWILTTGRRAATTAAKAVATSTIGRSVDAALIRVAAKGLIKAAQGRTYLSDDGILERLTEQLVKKTNQLRHDFDF